MTFRSEFEDRVDEQRRRELTRTRSKATTVDTAKIDLAVTDASREFLAETGVEADDTDADHVAAMVEGIIFYLLRRKGHSAPGLESQRREWSDWLDRVASVEGHNRPAPQTGSGLTTTTETSGDKPAFDRSSFDGLRLNRPFGR
jgi:hypothetical protein